MGDSTLLFSGVAAVAGSGGAQCRQGRVAGAHRLHAARRSVRGERVRCEVERGGTLTDRKGINLPGGALSAPALTVIPCLVEAK